MRRATAMVAVAALASMVAFVGAVAAPASGLVGRGSADTRVSITFKSADGTTLTKVTVADDGTYSTDFGISRPGESTATIKQADGTTLARIPITVTQAAEPCITPTAGTGSDWGVTHSPLPSDPKLPSYVTICGRIALAGSGSGATPAGTPPSLGTPGSVSRDDAGSSTGGVVHESGSGSSNDDDDGFPWWVLVVIILVVGVGVIVVMAFRRSHRDEVGSP